MAPIKADSDSGDAFGTIVSDEFCALTDINRYGTRTDLFDRFIAETDAHFRDPADSRYVDFELPFALGSNTVLPFSMVPELHSSIALGLTPQQHILFANDSALWWLSSILHGEQGALS